MTKPEFVILARDERRFDLNSLADVARARDALRAEILEMENFITVLDALELDLMPAAGAC